MLESVQQVIVESETYGELFEASHLAFLTATEGKTGRGCTLLTLLSPPERFCIRTGSGLRHLTVLLRMEGKVRSGLRHFTVLLRMRGKIRSGIRHFNVS